MNLDAKRRDGRGGSGASIWRWRRLSDGVALRAGRGDSSGSPAGHRRQDHKRVRLANGGVQPVEHAHVLVVEVDVDVAVERSVGGEQLVLRGRVVGGEVAQYVADPRKSGNEIMPQFGTQYGGALTSTQLNELGAFLNASTGAKH